MAQAGFEAGGVETRVVDQHLVRIDHEDIADAGFVAQPLKRECSIPRKIAPWLARHLAGKVGPGQECPDGVLGLVLRPGIDQQDIIDERTHALEAAADDVGLVLHDHAKANGIHALFR